MGSDSLREKCSSNDSDLPWNPPGARLLDKEWVLRDLCTGDLSGSPDLCSALPLGGVVSLSADDEIEEPCGPDGGSSSDECSCRGRSPPGNWGT